MADDPHRRHTFKIEVPPLVLGEASTSTGAPRVISPMPGKIIKILAKSGDNVTKGQALVILEAMKMEHVISAPADAVVDTIANKVGDTIQEGSPLVTLKAAA